MGLSWIFKTSQIDFFKSASLLPVISNLIICLEICISIFSFVPLGNEVLFQVLQQDIFFFSSLWIWLPVQMGLHWLLSAQAPSPASQPYAHGLLFLCGGAVLLGSALNHHIFIIPVATLLTACAIPMTLHTGANTNAGEAALKSLFDLRFALLFWALAITVGYGHMGSVDLRVWLHFGGENFYPAMLALLMLCGAVFTLLGVFPFHSNRVDLLSGGMATGALIIFVGHFIFLGGTLCRLAQAGDFPTPSVMSDGAMAALCMVAFAMSGLSALDQRTLDRLLAYLVIGNGTLLIPLIHFYNFDEMLRYHDHIMIAIFASLSFGSLLAYLAYSTLSQKEKEPLTWETCSGIGLSNPFLSFTFLLGVGTLSGFPGTLGFSARIALAQNAFDQGWLYTGWVILFSMPLQCLAVLRLASFLFFKKRTRVTQLHFNASLKIPSFILFIILMLMGILFGF